MGGLQRDHTVNEGWTNHEGYSDGTAGAAINNIMRQQRRQNPPAPTKKPIVSHGGTKFIQVEHRGAAQKTKPKAAPAPPKAKTPEQALLKMARTLFTICTMICRMQGFTIEAITLQDKESKTAWSKSDLEAPQPKK